MFFYNVKMFSKPLLPFQEPNDLEILKKIL